jgi:carboxymethylenebutenolidase
MSEISISGAASVPVLTGHLAVPPLGDPPWPGVVVLHEGPGLGDDVRAHADRFASAGFVAVAPDLYSAGGARRCMVATFRALARGHVAAFADIEAVRRWLSDRGDCSGRVGVVGFLYGWRLRPAGRGARL